MHLLHDAILRRLLCYRSARSRSYTQLHSILRDPMQKRDGEAAGVKRVVRLSDSQRAAWYRRKNEREEKRNYVNLTRFNTIIK